MIQYATLASLNKLILPGNIVQVDDISLYIYASRSITLIVISFYLAALL